MLVSIQERLVDGVRALFDRRQAAHVRVRAWWRRCIEGPRVLPGEPGRTRAETLVARMLRLRGQLQLPIVWAPDPVAAGCLLHQLVPDDASAGDPPADPRRAVWQRAPYTGSRLFATDTWSRVQDMWTVASTLDRCIDSAVEDAWLDEASEPYRWASAAAHGLLRRGANLSGRRPGPMSMRLPWSGLILQPHAAALEDAVTILGCVEYGRTPALSGRAGRALLALHELVDSVWELPGCVVLVPQAKRIALRAMQVHATDGPAIDYGPALRCFALEGVIVPHDAIEQPETIPELLRNEPWPTNRIPMKRHYGVRRYLERGCVLRDQDVRGVAPGADSPILFRSLCEDIDGDVWLVANDGSTAESHCMALPPKTRSVAEAASYLASAWDDTPIVAES